MCEMVSIMPESAKGDTKGWGITSQVDNPLTLSFEKREIIGYVIIK